MLLVDIAAGVALMLFGVRFLRKGLDRLFGQSLHLWLDRIAHSRRRAAFAGACVGIVAPSSTAQTLLSLQLLGSGRLSIERTLVFLLAANAGISATVQLIALRVFDYFGVFLVPGLAGFYLLRSPRQRGAAQVGLALGFIFLGMSLVSDQARELAAGPTFSTLLGLLAEQSVMVALLAAGFTVACQSSTACIGLALGLTASGHVSLALLIPVIVGANLGMGVTSVLASYTTREGRWLGAMNLGLKTALAFAALAALPSLTALLANTPGDLTRQAANFHTAFGLAVAALGFALARPLGALAQRELNRHRTDATPLGSPRSHLDPVALNTPRYALANAAREILRMGDETKAMLENAWLALETSNTELARSVQKHDDRIDETHAAIKRYLGQLSPEAMTPRDQHLQFGLLNFASQLEVIGDIVEKGLCGSTEKIARRPAFAAADEAALRDFYGQLHQRFDAALAVLATRDRELAEEFLVDGDRLKERCIEAQKAHYQRLQNLSDGAVLEASGRFIDVLNALRRISGLLNTIGHTFSMDAPPTLLAPRM